MSKLKELYEKYNLTKDDFFKHKHYTIIKREGIDKLQAEADIRITYELLYHSPDCKTAIVKATANKGPTRIETFGEVSPDNNHNQYPIAMAEKRAMSRAVLKLAGFYSEGVFGEDEIEDAKELPELPANKLDQAKKAIAEGNTTIEALQQNWHLTEQMIKALS